MRLTLRTLLAYLDDILEPTQTKEIGEKIAESGYASALVSRIREVMRRRRLTAPDLTGPESGVDPNSVAEYLDNTLAPEAVADVEKVCLDSDVHLAEVAASHQILTLVLGEPVEVPATARERMYALGSGSASKFEAIEESGETTGPQESAADTVPIVPAATGADRVPDYLRPAPVWQRFGPIVVAVAIGGTWLATILGDRTFSGPEDLPADALAQVDPSGRSGLDIEPAPAGPGTPGNNDGTSPASTAGTGRLSNPPADDVPPFESTPETIPTEPPAEPDVPEPPAPVAPDDPDPASTSIASTTPEVPGTNPEPTTPANPNPDTPPVSGDPTGTGTAAPPAETEVTVTSVEVPDMLYSTRDSVLLRRDETGWLSMPYRATLRAGDRVAAPEPFSADLRADALRLTITLHGGSALELIGASPEQTMQLAILRGRITIERDDPDGKSDPITIGLVLAGEPCLLTIPSGDTRCGIELNPSEPVGFETQPEQPYAGSLYVISGSVAFVAEVSGQQNLVGPAWYPLTPKERAEISATTPPPLLTTPEWLDPDSRGISATQRRYAVKFANAIDPDRPIRQSVPAIVQSSVPGLAELAVKCLAVADLPIELVQALAQSEFEESRDAAITGLRQWLPKSEQNAELLMTELQKVFPPDQVDPVYRLLWGYGLDDARNAATSGILIDWLSHDTVVIRQLAFQHIFRLTGQRYDYRPLNPENQRNVAIQRWQAHLKKTGGSLVQ